MYFVLGLIIELITIIGSASIIINGEISSIIDIAKKGYKIDKKLIDEYRNKQYNLDSTSSDNFKTILNTILLLIPGVNLISACIRSICARRRIFTDAKLKESIVPMSDEEKNDYSKLQNRKQKLLFAAFTATKNNNDEKIFAFIGDKPLVVDHKLTSIYPDPLPYYAYTYDDVKKLNSVTEKTFRVGKVDGRCFAIIGIPNKNYQFKRISFRNEDWNKTYEFEEMTEEEAKTKTFIIYPFMYDDEEKIKETVDNILEERKKKNKESNVGTHIENEFIIKTPIEEKAKVLSLTNSNIFKNR